MGTAVVAVVGGLGTAILMTDVHRKQSAVAGYLKVFAANLEGVVAASPTGYVACATPASYPDYTPGPPYDADVMKVLIWNGSSFVQSCASGDTGVQKVTLRVWSTDGRADQSLDLIIRKPCRQTDAACS